MQPPGGPVPGREKSTPDISRSGAPAASPQAVQAQLQRILASQGLVHAERLGAFLRFIVEESLAGRGNQLKEQVLGIEVFGRGESFDPRIDTVVRVEAHRLRSRLKQYYATTGRTDNVLIELAKGSYAPVFSVRRPPPRKGAWRRWTPLALAGAVVAAGLLVYAVVTGLRQTASSSPGPPALAVLPLTNLSGDPAQEFFADGMTEALIGDLATLRGIRVISRTSAMHYKQTDKRLPEIARELGVAYVVEGSVNRSGQRVRISAQLIEAATDRHLWSNRYERDLPDILTLEKEVARSIAAEIRVRLTPQEQRRFARSGVVNPKAHEAYLKGRYQSGKRTEDGLRKSIEHFHQALAEDAGYAPAYAGLAESYALLASYGLSPPHEVMPKAKAAAQRALEADDTLAEAHASLGFVKSFYDWDWPGAAQDYRLALEMNPNSATARHWYAGYLRAVGQLEDAVQEIRRAQALDPLSRAINRDLARTLYSMRRYEEAIQEFRRALDLEPDFPSGHLHLGMAYMAKSLHALALAEFLKARSLPGGNPLILGGLGYCYGVLGRKTEAQGLLKELEAGAKSGYVSPVSRAFVYIGLGDRDRAFQWLERACQERDGWLAWLKVDPMFDSLRPDPRFAGLLRTVRLAGTP